MSKPLIATGNETLVRLHVWTHEAEAVKEELRPRDGAVKLLLAKLMPGLHASRFRQLAGSFMGPIQAGKLRRVRIAREPDDWEKSVIELLFAG